MKKLFTLFFAFVASAGMVFASNTQVDGIWYIFDDNNQTATVTFQSTASYYNTDRYTGAIIIPDTVNYNSNIYSVTSIGSEAFSHCTGVITVFIPSSVKSIGNSAFNGCTSLTNINIPNSVTSIEHHAFNGCTSITNITIPHSVTCIEKYTFSGCSGLTSVTIPSSVTSIGENALSGCTNLSIIEIPNSVTSIGGAAFSGCTGLTNVTIPNSVTSIGNYAFQYCSGLTRATIPNNVTSIGVQVFRDCTGLTSITIPNNITSIGNHIIINCTNLLTVVAPAQIFESDEGSMVGYPKQLDSVVINSGELTDNVLSVVRRSYKTLKTLDVSAATNTTLPDEAFKDCYNLQTLVLPVNLESISYMAVAGCKNLKAIDIPASVEEIEQSAFENCRSLETITFGGASTPASGRFNALTTDSQLKKIGNWAFYNAHELQHLTIPEGVTEIGDGAFYGCVYLENLALPSSVQSIGDNCFALCTRIAKMDVDAVSPPAVEGKTFFEVSTVAPVYVPDMSVNAYKAHPIWGRLNIIGKSEAPTAIEYINPSAKLNGSRKLLRDGQIFILRDDKTYTLTGQEVK